MRVHVLLIPPAARRSRVPGKVTLRSLTGSGMLTGLLLVLAGSTARAQYPPAHIPELNERSGLMMRFAGTREQLPPDPIRDNFYNTRYADRGLIKHPDGIKDQGLYGLGWKAACTESVYPFFYGSPGTTKVTESCLPWHRSFRYVQGVTHPFRPVGMYYSMGSYVPIYDFDPIAPGPGPYPFPFFFNWNKGG
jgi:hypothetical protein